MISTTANTASIITANTTHTAASLLTWLLALLLGLSFALSHSPLANADIIYRIEDKDGNVIFTDTPPPNQRAETVELSPTNTQSTPAAPKAPRVAEKPASSSYTSIKLVQPTHNLTVPPGQLNVVAQLALEPQLHKDHLVQFFMDGKPQGKPIAATSISIGSLSRGEHRIRAQVIDNNKGVVASTNTVTIHVKRHSAQR